MRRRLSRPWRAVKWCATALCLTILIAWVGNGALRFGYNAPERGPRFLFASGGVNLSSRGTASSGSDAGFYAYSIAWNDLCNEFRWWPYLYDGHAQWQVFVPLWLPAGVLALPTFILWWRDCRHAEGNCPYCGYDLTGNVSGVCPECGRSIRLEGPDSCDARRKTRSSS